MYVVDSYENIKIMEDSKMLLTRKEKNGMGESENRKWKGLSGWEGWQMLARKKRVVTHPVSQRFTRPRKFLRQKTLNGKIR